MIKLQKQGSHYIYLSVVLMDSSVFNMGKNYYSQVFWEECKYIIKKKDVTRDIIEYLAISSDADESDKE